MKPRGTTVTIRRVTDGTRSKEWGVFWNEYRPGFAGRPKQKAKFYVTEAEAREVKARVEAALQGTSPVPVEDADPHQYANSLGALSVDWLAHVKGCREAATHKSYTGLVKNYLAPKPAHKRYPGLGQLIISDATVTPRIVADYLTQLCQAGISLSMRRRLHRAVSALCSYARFTGLLTKDNPCADVGRSIRQRGEEDQEPTPNPFTQDEIALIFDQIEACEPDWLPYFQFLYDTGVRPGEAAGLRWDDLDFDLLKVKIAWSWSPAAHADKIPKTHERRKIDLSRLAADRLLGWRPEQRRELLRRGLKQAVYVFTSRRGARAFQDGNVRVVFARVMKACAISGHSLYDFRDSFASHHLADAWDRKLTWVSKQLGHKHVSTTERYYFTYRPTNASRGFADEIRGVK